MTTYRKSNTYWTEVKRVVKVDGKPFVKQTTCCCDAPGATARQCRQANPVLKSKYCPCHCHRAKATDQEEREARRDWAKGHDADLV